MAVIISIQQFPTFPPGNTEYLVGAAARPCKTTTEVPATVIVAIPEFSVLYPSLRVGFVFAPNFCIGVVQLERAQSLLFH